MNLPFECSSWDELYQEKEVEILPWFHPVLDPDIAQALQQWQIKTGEVLDLGTGPGTQAIALAKLGFQVTATDVSETAIEKARLKAKSESVSIDFLVDDISASKLQRSFDLIIDRGCFHIFEPAERQIYIAVLHDLLKPAGFFFLKCFSHLEPSEEGPNRFRPEEIADEFRPHFSVKSVESTVYYGTRQPLPRALFCVLSKL
ncbi:MAG: class I SAM-dependent methyltransferase [bacterium]